MSKSLTAPQRRALEELRLRAGGRAPRAVPLQTLRALAARGLASRSAGGVWRLTREGLRTAVRTRARTTVRLQLPALPCPHCRRPSREYRMTSDGAWICAALECGRSFRPRRRVGVRLEGPPLRPVPPQSDLERRVDRVLARGRSRIRVVYGQHEMAAVYAGRELVMAGNTWDFHPGCHGLYTHAEWRSAALLGLLLEERSRLLRGGRPGCRSVTERRRIRL